MLNWLQDTTSKNCQNMDKKEILRGNFVQEAVQDSGGLEDENVIHGEYVQEIICQSWF